MNLESVHVTYPWSGVCPRYIAVVSRHIAPYRAVSRHIAISRAISRHIAPYRAIPLYRAISRHIAPYRAISRHIAISCQYRTKIQPEGTLQTRGSNASLSVDVWGLGAATRPPGLLNRELESNLHLSRIVLRSGLINKFRI